LQAAAYTHSGDDASTARAGDRSPRRVVTRAAFTDRKPSICLSKCPACDIPIAHDGDQREPTRVYRCHVCRLDLVLDEPTD
jgi:hypothetical protein